MVERENDPLPFFGFRAHNPKPNLQMDYFTQRTPAPAPASNAGPPTAAPAVAPPPLLTLLPARNAFAHILGTAEDPFFVRPVDLVRRAFDELALTLHYYIAGLLFSGDDKYEFISKNQFVRTVVARQGVASGRWARLG
jgi:hypothetical protein